MKNFLIEINRLLHLFMNLKYDSLHIVPGAKDKVMNKTSMCPTYKDLNMYLFSIFINLYSKIHSNQKNVDYNLITHFLYYESHGTWNI